MNLLQRLFHTCQFNKPIKVKVVGSRYVEENKEYGFSSYYICFLEDGTTTTYFHTPKSIKKSKCKFCSRDEFYD